MNQQIQVIDGFEYIEEKSALKIQCIAGGALINCFVLGVKSKDAGRFYKELQFDIEEEIIERIEKEDFNASGEIEIPISKF